MTYWADLHIHSRYSRATSKNLSLELLAAWAEVKGIHLLATGDCLHAAWLTAIKETLIPDGNGFFILRDPKVVAQHLPWYHGSLAGSTRFILSTEISSIYTAGGRVRKIHNLVYLPTVEAAQSLRQRLLQIGNLDADGRPILGLNSRDLLAMVLDTHPEAFLVPAHIWTPWFSLFGSKSGFDTIEECFGDLAGEVFALETGLSSDPEMNWLVSALDRFRLISNSDAHSGEKLGREANRFAGAMDFAALRGALAGTSSVAAFLGTVEFFPEEGKYHLDGHRACEVVLTPTQTRELGGICPRCGKPLTLGVLHRVYQLADRDEPQQPPEHPGFVSLIPLTELVAEVLGKGSGTQVVRDTYAHLISTFGPELPLLLEAPEADLRSFHPLLGEAIARMRRGQVLRTPGYDGIYGRIHTLTPEDRIQFGTFSPLPLKEPHRRSRQAHLTLDAQQKSALPPTIPQTLNPEQMKAIHAPGPLLVSAGPGTGKTHTLVARILALLTHGVPAHDILVLTFTRKAAQELRHRLQLHLGPGAALPRADTLHALAFAALGEQHLLLGEDEAFALFARAHPEYPASKARNLYTDLQRRRETLTAPPDPAFTSLKAQLGVIDYTDLLERWWERLRVQPSLVPHVLVDEAQDLSPLQWQLVRALSGDDGAGVFLIGDTDQSIYGFRGAAGDLEAQAKGLWPNLQTLRLTCNYRSIPTIIRAMAPFSRFPALHPVQDGKGEVRIGSFATAEHEARWIAHTIAAFVGQRSHWQMDTADTDSSMGLGEVAILVRVQSLIPPFEAALREAGVPVYRAEGDPVWSHPGVAAVVATVQQALGVETVSNAAPHPSLLEAGPRAVATWLVEQGQLVAAFLEVAALEELTERYTQAGSWKALLTQRELELANHAAYQSAQKVALLTIHAAKGLEFNTVFMPCLEEGLLPWHGSSEEEERRIFYVAMSRARQRLILTYARQRHLWGRVQRTTPSRFLVRIPQELVRPVDERTKTISRQLAFV